MPSGCPTPKPTPAHAAHIWIDTADVYGSVTDETPLDGELTDAARFQVYRVRAQIVNSLDVPVTVSLQIQALVGGQWHTLPEDNPAVGMPFYAASDDGRTFQDREVVIPVGALRMSTSDDPHAAPVPGLSVAGDSTAKAIGLSAHSFTEVEFAVRASTGAAWSQQYPIRLVDLAKSLTAPIVVNVTMRAKPALDLSPGQRSGTSEAGASPQYPLSFASPALQASFASFVVTGGAASTPMAPGYQSPHLNYTLVSDACAICHGAHTGRSANLVRGVSPVATLCLQCHNGTGATNNVQAEFSAPGVLPNDPTTDSYYQHPTLQATSHTSDHLPEFAGVLNRHTECSDCHQPHRSDGTPGADSTSGWTAGGATVGAAGVSVANGPAGSSPTYTLNPSTTLEYQLCFKCHSGYTTLPTSDPTHPSWAVLDKAVEFNPANVSYHPIEAAGRNQSTAMAQSLAGTSPSKIWSFQTTSTIRCTNCHADPSSIAGAVPPAASAELPAHASPNRGLLIAPYRDRTLLSSYELYDPGNFSLCYVCHSEAPFVDDSGDQRTDTNFNFHGFHLNDIHYNGTGGTSIDVPGDGQSNALCAECHFRTHSDVSASNGQSPQRALVNFAPDVQPANGVISFVPATPTTLGSCTLTCHGKTHVNLPYGYGLLP